MKSIIRTASRSLCVPFFWTLLVAGAWNFSAAQVLEPDGRAARFPKIDMRGAHAAAARLASSTGPDFYDEYIKGKRVLINFFYTRCDRGVCNQLMNNLVQVQRLLGDRLGQDVFICSITLDPEHDTPDVLQAYANKLGAKPGWSFLRGSVQDTTALREKLGLADLPPEVARRLDAVSPQVAASGKSIEATAANVWQPKSLRALEDDRIVWKLSDGTPGEHGLQITNWEMVKQFVEVEPVEGQQPFNATTGKNDLPTETAGKVLLRLKLNTAPPVPTRITYDCIVHGTTMSGEVSLGQRHTGMLYVFDDPANHHSLVSVDATPTEILEALGRLRSLTISAPSGGSAALPEITIDAGPGVAWMSGGNASTPTTPLKVTAQKGQTLVFRHNDPNLRHGIVFLTENLVLLKGDDPASKPGAVLQQTDDLGLYNKKVSPGPTPKELARFEVIQDIGTAPAFECTVHLADMAGSVNAPGITMGAGAGNLETALTTMSPSMQRRILRFVNRANRPEDLMKSPQEFRTSEHVPPGAHKSSPDAKVGFARVMAEALIKGRPLYGYRDVRECLPIYKSSGKPEDLSKVLESAGPSRFGKWDEVGGETPSVMHAAMLHTGKVLLITDSTDTAFWDPAGSPQVLSGSVTGLADILYCSGHSFLSDGRLLAVGGGGSDPGAGSSIHGWKFDTASSKWSRTSADMAVRRWYPTLVTLGDEPGRILVAAGLTSRVGTPAPHMEVYSETTDSFETITATGPAGELLFRPTYPGLHLLPGGEIFHAPTGFNDCNQAPITSGDVADPTAIFRFASDVSGSWTTLAANNRLKGMSVLLFNSTPPFIQGLVAGGGEAPKNGTAQAIDLSSVSPAWSPTFPLLEARVHPNLVVLPDGTVFICGGKVASANPPPNGGRCELYDPKTGLTSEMDELIVPRHYHSVALLLPDARVMMAGGADDAGCTISTQKTIEVFSPPYLFRGSRPLITSAANFVEHGATIEIKTPAASEIQRVVLARPAAVTHQTDSEQRVLPLSFQVTGPDMIEAKAPGGTGANPIAPRGHYMLFILNQQGVPSVSKWVFVR